MANFGRRKEFIQCSGIDPGRQELVSPRERTLEDTYVWSGVESGPERNQLRLGNGVVVVSDELVCLVYHLLMLFRGEDGLSGDVVIALPIVR